MANVDLLAPIISRWEGGYQCYKEDGGNYNSKKELVGTNMGITAQTFESVFGKCPTVEDMKAITVKEFSMVLKKYYWDRWKADNISNQSIANILVDWVWASGVWGIKIPQRVLLVKDDGAVGKKTLEAVNSASQKELFDDLKQARLDFVDEIIKNNPSQVKFEKGWKNRINSFLFIE